MALTEAQRWHATWIIAVLIQVAGTIIGGFQGMAMMPLIILVLCCWAAAVLLSWIIVRGTRLLGKILLTAILTLIACVAIGWAVRYDRPVLSLETDGIVSQNGSDGTVLNIEADVNNIGRQSSYGQDWRFHIKFEATEIEGSERFGLKRPEWTADEPELYNQEFSVGKPVRGWLYFAFPDSVSQQMRLIFNCTSPSPAVATLSFFDSKEKHLWEKEIDLVALIKNSCRSTPTNTAVAAAPPQGPQPAHRHSQPKNATGLPTTERPPLANFRNITALGGATAILDCDPLATFDGVTAVTTSQTEPALDIGSSKCQNQESFAEFGAYTQLKTDLGNDAGNKEAIKSDLGKLRKRLTELRDPLHLQKEYEDKLNRQFSDMETAFLAVADSREKTLHLLSGLRITHR